MSLWSGIAAILAIIASGGVIVCLGLLLLGEYRNAFLRDPRAVMTLEVFARLGGVAGPGYLAMVLLVIGTLMVLSALAGLVTLAGFLLIEVLF